MQETTLENGDKVKYLLEKFKYLGRGRFEPEIGISDFLYHLVRLSNSNLTRNEIVDITGIPRTTIYETIEGLIYNGKLKKEQVFDKKRGRPKIIYKIA